MNDRKSQQLLSSIQNLQSRLHDSDLRIIDCRFELLDPDAGKQAYLDKHIPGAVYADLDTDLAAPIKTSSGRHPLPDIDALAATFRRLGICRDMPVVVYDSSGGAIASRAWWLLRWLGHHNVTLLDGGLQAWQAMNLPLESGQNTVHPGNFIAQPRDEQVLTTEEVVANIVSIAELSLVDARDEARFRGEVEPIDSVAGHIPGTLNLPFTASLNEDGTWRPETALQALWRPVLGQSRDTPWAVMCGSGVTACHLAISGLLAGYTEPRLYVGSWSEWIRDPERPIAMGRS